MKVTYFPKDEVWAAARRYAHELPLRHPEVRRILLFGSVARNRAVPGSDADLLVVVSASDRPFRERMPHYAPDNFPVDAEVFVYTEGELEQMLKDGNWFLRRALSEGISLYESADR